jgi:hypothetical protein
MGTSLALLSSLFVRSSRCVSTAVSLNSLDYPPLHAALSSRAPSLLMETCPVVSLHSADMYAFHRLRDHVASVRTVQGGDGSSSVPGMH